MVIGALVNKMHLHRETLAFEGVFTRGVKVKLFELIRVSARGQCAALVYRHLDGVTVVHDVDDMFVVTDCQ
jgi:transposase